MCLHAQVSSKSIEVVPNFTFIIALHVLFGRCFIIMINLKVIMAEFNNISSESDILYNNFIIIFTKCVQ